VVEGIIPSVPSPVTKPSDERLAKLPAGLSACNAVRKKLNRASFTAVAPKFLALLITNCCAREAVLDGKPGTLANANALSTVASSIE
jgi:hypothetical protein